MQSEAWTQFSKLYAGSFERATWMWARDALTIAGFTDKLDTPLQLLDIACGPGRLAVTAAEMGFEVTATDWSAGMLECVRARAAEASCGISTQVADGQTLEGLHDNAYDVVTCNFAAYHFANPLAGMRAALRVLKPGGRLLETVWTAQSIPAMGVYAKKFAQDLPSTNKTEDNKGGTHGIVPSVPSAAKFEHDLQDQGFAHVTVYKVTHDVCFPSGKMVVDAMLNSAVNALRMPGKDLGSVKLCLLHYLDLVSQGVDPLVDPQAPRPPTPDEQAAEEMAFWNKPVIVTATAHVAIAEKRV